MTEGFVNSMTRSQCEPYAKKSSASWDSRMMSLCPALSDFTPHLDKAQIFMCSTGMERTNKNNLLWRVTLNITIPVGADSRIKRIVAEQSRECSQLKPDMLSSVSKSILQQTKSDFKHIAEQMHDCQSDEQFSPSPWADNTEQCQSGQFLWFLTISGLSSL